MALGAGFLLAATILERIPETIEDFHLGPVLILIGYLILMFAERAMEGRESNNNEHEVHQPHLHHQMTSAAGVGALVGLVIHAFFDGMAVASGFAASRATGLLVFLAVLLHKVPEGIGMSAIALVSGSGKRRALGASLALGVATLLGGGLTLVAGQFQPGWMNYAVALATGSFLYVATSDLMPSVSHGSDRGTLLWFVAGMGIYSASLAGIHLLGLH